MNQAKESSPHFTNFLISLIATTIGVLLAFWLSNQAAARNATNLERSTLREIKIELNTDLIDMMSNKSGHVNSIYAIKKFRNYLEDPASNLDSVQFFFLHLLRDFVSIQHDAAYQTLKSRGLETITQDSLRLIISNLYDISFEALVKIEEQYTPHEFHLNYFNTFLNELAPYIDFTNQKRINASSLPSISKNKLHTILNKIEYDRQFLIHHYNEIIEETKSVIVAIDRYLASGS